MRASIKNDRFCQKTPKKIFRLDGFGIAPAGRYSCGSKLLASLRKVRPTCRTSYRSVEGVHDAPSETNFKTKASKQGPAGIGGRWIITVTRKRRVRSPEWAGGYANLKDRR